MKSCETCLRGPEPQRIAYCINCGDDLNNFVALKYSEETEEEKRIDIISQNGNDGLHYADPIVEAVRDKLIARSEAGMLKYGVTLARKDLSRLDWLNHLQQELLDAANYVQVLIEAEHA